MIRRNRNPWEQVFEGSTAMTTVETESGESRIVFARQEKAIAWILTSFVSLASMGLIGIATGFVSMKSSQAVLETKIKTIGDDVSQIEHRLDQDLPDMRLLMDMVLRHENRIQSLLENDRRRPQ